MIFILLFLFIGTTVFAQGPTTPFHSSAREGRYALQQGTDHCPQELTWKRLPKCSGFQLSETRYGRAFPEARQELFCHINKGSYTDLQRNQARESFKVRYKVQADERLAQKDQEIERNFNGAPYTVELQASVILDNEKSFMFDRSLNGHGWSCLYKKTDSPLKPLARK